VLGSVLHLGFRVGSAGLDVRFLCEVVKLQECPMSLCCVNDSQFEPKFGVAECVIMPCKIVYTPAVFKF